MAKKATATKVTLAPVQEAEATVAPLELTAMHVAILAYVMEGEAGEQGYGMQVPDAHMTPLYEAGYVVANESIKNPATGAIAHKMTQAGIDAYERHQALTKQDDADTAINTMVGAPKMDNKFDVETDVAMPDFSARGGTGRAEVYPFEQLGVGHSFFVPATEKRPEPHKSLVSTVNQATLRYSKVIEGANAGTRVNRQGKIVPLTEPTRVFKLVKGERAGVTGARVFRIS